MAKTLVSISIAGAGVPSPRPKYWVTLGDSGWVGGEPGNASKVLAAKSGKWKYELTRGTLACYTASNALVIEFTNLNPDTVKVGAKGLGHSHLTGDEVDWTVQSL